MLTPRERFQTVVANTATVVVPVIQVADPTIVGLHFEYGSDLEVQKRLVKMGGTQAGQFQKFPMVAVIETVPLRNVQGNLWIMEPRIYITTHTDSEYDREQREAHNFKLILWPIVYELRRQMRVSGLLGTDYKQLGTVKERPNMGREGTSGSDGLIYTDPMDGIEITGWQLTIRETNACSQAFSKNF